MENKPKDVEFQYLQDGKSLEKASPPPLSLAHLYSTGEEAGGRPGARREGGCNDASGKERAQLLDQERRKERKITQIGDIENVEVQA